MEAGLADTFGLVSAQKGMASSAAFSVTESSAIPLDPPKSTAYDYRRDTQKPDRPVTTLAEG